MPIADLNTLDILILVILGFTLVRGLFRGFIGEISSIAGLIAGFFLANKYHSMLLPLMESIFPDPGIAQLLSYALVFCTGLVGVLMVAAVLRHLLRVVLLGWVDRFAGGVIGLLKGALLCILLVLLLTTFLSPQAEILTTSRMAPQINRFSAILADLLPPEMRREFEDKSQPLRQSWRENVQQRLSGGQGGQQR
ncbi:CvpA family protein [Desulfonatronum thioautotrophicum]|uniref:CvpA family protein n=1 Tax=Desulfonatronum thioautotrophicum TaxID=617001 RepID=UPI000699F50B|nr:CvpA family protein [Desulfonatronum thioautotrophicum]